MDNFRLRNENMLLTKSNNEFIEKFNIFKVNGITIQSINQLSNRIQKLDSENKVLIDRCKELEMQIELYKKSSLEKDTTIAELVQKNMDYEKISHSPAISTRKTLYMSVLREKIFGNDDSITEIYLELVKITNLYNFN